MKRYIKKISPFSERSKSWIKLILSSNKEELFCISLRDLEY